MHYTPNVVPDGVFDRGAVSLIAEGARNISIVTRTLQSVITPQKEMPRLLMLFAPAALCHVPFVAGWLCFGQSQDFFSPPLEFFLDICVIFRPRP